MNYCLRVKTAHRCTPTLMLIYRTGMLWSLFFFMLSLSQDVSAGSELRDKGAVEDETVLAPEDEVAIPVGEVEAGAGGNIKLEREYRSKVENQYAWHAHLLLESHYVTEGVIICRVSVYYQRQQKLVSMSLVLYPGLPMALVSTIRNLI